MLLSKCNPSRVRDQLVAQSAEARKRILGQTCEGRYLAVVVTVRPGNVFRPITGWPTRQVDRVRFFNDEEMAILQALAQRRSVTASVVIRELVREQGPPRR